MPFKDLIKSVKSSFRPAKTYLSGDGGDGRKGEVKRHPMILLELAVTTPLTSIHCERVFSRMKQVVSPAPS